MSAAKPIFLDLLSDDIISIIVRYTSTRPHTDDWHEYVNPRVLSDLLKCEGRISYWARDAISRVRHVEIDMQARKNPDLDQIMPHLHNVRYSYHGEKEVPRSLLHIPNLRKLHIETNHYQRFPFDVTLSACGATLHTLTLCLRSFVGTKEVIPISRECPALKVLNLSAYSFHEHELEPLWPAIGKTLTKLTLKTLYVTFVDNTELLEPIARNCVVLEDVKLNHPQHIWLYKQLGAQLKIIRLDRDVPAPNVQDVSDVLELCPNAIVHGFVSTLSDDALVLLSSRMASFSGLRMLEPFPEMPYLQEASMVVTENRFPAMKSFFDRPIPSLRKLYLLVENGNVFEPAAKSVTCLEELRVTIQCFDVAGAFGENDFDELLYANPRLRKLRISFYDEELTCYEKVERFLVALFGSLKNFKELSVIEVDGKIVFKLNKTIIRDASVLLRSRRISIIWNGIVSFS